MTFDPARAQRSIVESTNPEGRHVGMGVMIDQDLVPTVAHCLPSDKSGAVIFPNPDALGSDWLPVHIRSSNGRRAIGLVAAADPCADVAVVADSTRGGSDLPSDEREQYLHLLPYRFSAKLLFHRPPRRVAFSELSTPPRRRVGPPEFGCTS